MQPGKIYFLVNARDGVNLAENNSLLLFGSTEYFKKAVSKIFSEVIHDLDGVMTLKTENAILKFYYGDSEVIEKFVMVDVLLSDEPSKDVSIICKENKWQLFDLEAELYVDIEV